jgi:hypothetical protein
MSGAAKGLLHTSFWSGLRSAPADRLSPRPRRVVGTPSAATTSLMIYSRSTWAECGAAVAVTRGEGSAPGALELDIAPLAVPPHELARQDGAPVTKSRNEAAELMPGIGERSALHPRAGGCRQGSQRLRRGPARRDQVRRFRLPGIQPHQLRRGHGRWIEVRVQALRKAQGADRRGRDGRDACRGRPGRSGRCRAAQSGRRQGRGHRATARADRADMALTGERARADALRDRAEVRDDNLG